MKVQSEANLPAVLHGKDHLSGPLIKEPLLQQFLCGHHLVLHVLILRQRPDKAQDQPRVPPLRRAELQMAHFRPFPPLLAFSYFS